MNEKISNILDQIRRLEEDIQHEMELRAGSLSYRLKGKKIEFEQSIREAHKTAKVGLLRWLITCRPQNILTAPIIYSMILPLVLFDLCINLYQYSCFPIYGISRVRRADYFAYDHRHLVYLNIIEKMNCLYCSYANGLMAFSSEIVARTEQYFCPIKHAQKLKGSHARYRDFVEYGDATEVHKILEELRNSLIRENEQNKH